MRTISGCEVLRHLENALARVLRAAHETLSLVATEDVIGTAGVQPVVGTTPAMVQKVLTKVLTLFGASVNPATIDAKSLMATINQAKSLVPLPLEPARTVVVTCCPTFGEVLAATSNGAAQWKCPKAKSKPCFSVVKSLSMSQMTKLLMHTARLTCNSTSIACSSGRWMPTRGSRQALPETPRISRSQP